MFVTRSLSGVSLAAVATALSLASPAQAQTSASSGSASQTPQTAESSPAEAAATGEIVVTATRRNESIQDVPVSITALSEKELEERHITDIKSLALSSPGVIATGEGSFNKPTIRAIQTSQTTSSSGTQRPVAVFLDDLPLTSSSAIIQDVAPYDLNRIEVLRGPQGTLFGSGSLAGLIRYITNKPNPDEFDASADLDLGSTAGGSHRASVGAMLNVPLVQDQLALRVSGFLRDDDGYVDNIGTGVKNANTTKDKVLRASVLWAPDSRFTGSFTFNYASNRVGDSPLYDPVFGVNVYSSPRPWITKVDLYHGNLTLDYDMGWATLTSATTYASSPQKMIDLNIFGAVPTIPLFFGLDSKILTKQQELRLASNSNGRLEWVTGLYYLEQTAKSAVQLYVPTEFVTARNITGAPTNINNGSTISNTLTRTTSTEAAVFGEASYRVTEALKIIAGGRLTNSKYENRALPSLSLPRFYVGAFTGGNIDISAPLTTQADFTTGNELNFTPKLGVQWQPNNDLNIYAVASKGFRRPKANGNSALVNGGRSVIDPNDPVVIPIGADGDSLWNYEVGTKATMLGGRLTANLAAYYITWDDIQIQLIRPSDQATFDGNAGDAEAFGFEAEVVLRPAVGLEIGANLTLQEGKIVTIDAVDAKISGATEGSRLSSPKFKGGAHVRYGWSVNENDFYGRVDFYRAGSFPNTFPNAPGTGKPDPGYSIVPASSEINASMGWSRGRLGAVLYADNLTNSDSIIFVNPPRAASARVGTRRPRTIGIRLSWDYQ
ncbi:TonB-dependent receptor [Parafrankia sp. BMG5.11]|uniref:TonB-dependent receptor n=1 Tax=Parafrankia sp. BMG5.11 TaxID=222540 RepID=UPI00103C6204|nr:TonB-dependent receptor [Parafrankia sp. BMG5.11]TCJ41407.1 hypothetical protein E0504_02040 [Parafrankia sp. BMG5.11]